ncbi:MAG: MBL fold metallo-hydrolase [Ramlibacter sp.]|nr:MBL fold metallo-hydrolase [Ramlibacter sp.]
MNSPGDLPRGVSVLERGWLSANNIVFRGSVTAVVDTGYWTHQEQTLALIDQELDGAPLALLANTHLHSDHCGGNAALQARYPRMKTLIPPGLSAQVRDWDPDALTYAPTGQFCPRFRFDGLLESGQEVLLGDLRWQIHSAPGHDPNSIILFEPVTRTLISADALWGNGFGVVFQELEGVEAFDEVAATLDLIESLEPLTVIPGHGPVFIDVAASLGRARQRLARFQKDPEAHARHAAKVLLKFKLLEAGQMKFEDLAEWATLTRYFQLVHARHFTDSSPNEWIRRLVSELVQGGAAHHHDGVVSN